MNTLTIINWSTVAMAVTALITVGIFLFIASFFIAELQKKRFTLQYETLKDFINKAPLDKENYQAIYDMFNETYCYSDGDVKLIKNLWTDFRVKYRNIVPVEDKDLFPDIKELTSKKTHSDYERLKRKSNVELIKS
jgi:hypothetical protein